MGQSDGAERWGTMSQTSLSYGNYSEQRSQIRRIPTNYLNAALYKRYILRSFYFLTFQSLRILATVA